MSETKRYYWLKLKEDFFEEDTIAWLEEQEKGKEYALFYLKLCLKSLKTDGCLIRKVGQFLVPYDTKKLSEITNTDYDTVVVAMELLKKIGLVEILENGEIYLTQLNSMVGSETSKASIMRKSRAKKSLTNQNGNIVTPMLPLSSNIVDTEIEYRDKSIDIDNIICPNSDDLDVSEQLSLEGKLTDSNVIEVNISETIERIYKAFPRKEGKAKGFEYAIAFLKGRKIAGLGTVKYNHEQLYCAVRQYSFECEDNHTEERYIKLFSTFMNKPVCDYVEKSVEGYESYMERTYGNEWRNIKFTYR